MEEEKETEVQNEVKSKNPIVRKWGTVESLILGISLLYTFLLIYIGFCLDAGAKFVSAKNIFAQMVNGMGFTRVQAGTSGVIGNILVAIYISVFVFAVLHERLLLSSQGISLTSKRAWFTYIITFIVCGLLSWGLAFLIQYPYSGENAGGLASYIGQTLLIGTIVYLFFAILVAAIVLVFFSLLSFFVHPQEKQPKSVKKDEEDDDNDVTKNFASPEVKAEKGITIGANGSISGGAPATTAEVALGEREKVFPSLCRIDETYNGMIQKRGTDTKISLSEMARRFRNYLAKEKKLYYEPYEIRAFLSGLGISHLSILQGLSGTGKSSLPRAFADFIGAKAVFLPVQATWRDKSAILGYYNDFSGVYHETNGLVSLYEAGYQPEILYIFVLDEMNISRAEYYFADFLSVLEYPENDWKINVQNLPYGFIPPVRLVNGDLKFGHNCYFVGTANMDESTFAIADKVYDRAVVLDFNSRRLSFEPEGESSPIKMSVTGLNDLFASALENKDSQFNKNDEAKLNEISKILDDEFQVSFGNRSFVQLQKFVPLYIGCGGTKEEALDLFLTEKVIRKLSSALGDRAYDGMEKLKKALITLYGETEMSHAVKAIENLEKRL